MKSPNVLGISTSGSSAGMQPAYRPLGSPELVFSQSATASEALVGPKERQHCAAGEQTTVDEERSAWDFPIRCQVAQSLDDPLAQALTDHE